MYFHAGGSGGPDGLRLGHLRSLVARGSAEAGSRLLSVLTDLVNVMLRREVPQFAVPILYGANECAVREKDGGTRSTVVGSTIRRLGANGLKASLPGSRRRAEAGAVGGLNQWELRGGSASGPTLCRGLSPQNGPAEDRHA